VLTLVQSVTMLDLIMEVCILTKTSPLSTHPSVVAQGRIRSVATLIGSFDVVDEFNSNPPPLCNEAKKSRFFRVIVTSYHHYVLTKSTQYDSAS
jgi:hypothetical protein